MKNSRCVPFSSILFLVLSLFIKLGWAQQGVDFKKEEVEIVIGDGPSTGEVDRLLFAGNYVAGFAGNQFWIWNKQGPSLYATYKHDSTIIASATENSDSFLFIDSKGCINRFHLALVSSQKVSNVCDPVSFTNVLQILPSGPGSFLINSSEGIFRIGIESRPIKRLFSWPAVASPGEVQLVHGFLTDESTVLALTRESKYVWIGMDLKIKSAPEGVPSNPFPGLTNSQLHGRDSILREYCDYFAAEKCRATDFVFSSDLRFVASLPFQVHDPQGPEKLSVIDLKSGKVAHEIVSNLTELFYRDAAIDEEGRFLALMPALMNPMWDYGGIQFIDAQSKTSKFLAKDEVYIFDVDVSDDGVILAAGSVSSSDEDPVWSGFVGSWDSDQQNGTVILDERSYAELTNDKENDADLGFASQVRVSPDKKRVAIDGYGYTLSLALQNMKPVQLLAEYEHCMACRVKFDHPVTFAFEGKRRYNLINQEVSDHQKLDPSAHMERDRSLTSLPQNLKKFVKSIDGSFVRQQNGKLAAVTGLGKVFVWNLKRDVLAGELFFFRDGGWVFITADRYLSGNEKGLARVKFRYKQQIHDSDRFQHIFFRPDLVNKTLQ